MATYSTVLGDKAKKAKKDNPKGKPSGDLTKAIQATGARDLSDVLRQHSLIDGLLTGGEIIGGGDDRYDRLLGELDDKTRRTQNRSDIIKRATGLATRDAALSARRQQREGTGASSQSSAVRRALAMARGRQGGTLGSGDDPGRKTVLGGGM